MKKIEELSEKSLDVEANNVIYLERRHDFHMKIKLGALLILFLMALIGGISLLGSIRPVVDKSLKSGVSLWHDYSQSQ